MKYLCYQPDPSEFLSILPYRMLLDLLSLPIQHLRVDFLNTILDVPDEGIQANINDILANLLSNVPRNNNM